MIVFNISKIHSESYLQQKILEFFKIPSWWRVPVFLKRERRGKGFCEDGYCCVFCLNKRNVWVMAMMLATMRFLPAVEMTCWRPAGLRSTYEKRSMIIVTMRFLPAVEMTWWRHVGLRSTYEKRSMIIVTKRFFPVGWNDIVGWKNRIANPAS